MPCVWSLAEAAATAMGADQVDHPLRYLHSLFVLSLLGFGHLPFNLTLSLTHIHSLSPVLVVMMKSKELKTKIYSHAHSLILSLWNPVYTHTHTFIITLHYTCCYDEIKGTQDLKNCSHADSLHNALSLNQIFLSAGVENAVCRFGLTSSFLEAVRVAAY